MADNTRYEINHDGEIVQKTTALSNKLEVLIQELFSQYGWSYTVLGKHSVHWNIKLESPLGDAFDIDLFAGNIRNESRSPYEKKIQLSKMDPREYKDGVTLILGFYVFEEDDDIQDAIIMGYPVDEKINYKTNPSIRGVFVNDILLKAKNIGVCVDKARKLVGFRPEFIFYYLENYKDFHGYSEGEDTVGDLGHLNKGELVFESDFPRNRILFGAPGTGKSYTLNQDRKSLLGEDEDTNYERVTFHPDYSYANFVGTYKPVPYKDSDGKDSITYAYVPGPFMRIYVEAVKSGRTDHVKPYLLIIEEINRANVAAVFGDVFQLLDRENYVSEYPITPSKDMREYLARPDVLGGLPEDYCSVRIPGNMFIWATMNSADQGVFPMDTAFKRRWDFTYLGIDDNDEKIRGKKVILGRGEANSRVIEWNELRKAINDELSDHKINEDKLLGPYFLSKSIIPEEGEIDTDSFIDAFKSKVIMYLFEDAARHKRDTIFAGCLHRDRALRYSEICAEFEEKGVFIFSDKIKSRFNEKPLQPAAPEGAGTSLGAGEEAE